MRLSAYRLKIDLLPGLVMILLAWLPGGALVTAAKFYHVRPDSAVDFLALRALPGKAALIAAAYLGLSTVRFHPAADRGHLRWLKTTPWKPGMPLPLGNPFTRLEDLIALALFDRAAVYLAAVSPITPIVFYCLGYLL